jgi:hypothetical protein
MTRWNIRKNIKKGVRALTDDDQPSPSPSVSATETASNSRSTGRNMGEGVALVSPVNESNHQTSVPTPTIQVSSEQQSSSVVASANAVSFTEENRPLAAVCALHYAITRL